MLKGQNFILGKNTLDEVIIFCQANRALFLNKKVVIILFNNVEPGNLNRSLAARISAKLKTNAFRKVGLDVDRIFLPDSISILEFNDLIQRFNDDPNIIGVIAQMPVPDKIKESVKSLSKDKDIDAVVDNNDKYEVCATAESVVRILSSFSFDQELIAVVGGRGFVGGGVVHLLQKLGKNYFILEAGDDLEQVRNADVIITATGIPELLDQRHIKKSYRLVIDVGFNPVPGRKVTVLGDVNRNAYPLAKNITPVPGGVGPFQIATLLERIFAKFQSDPGDIKKWTYIPDQ